MIAAVDLFGDRVLADSTDRQTWLDVRADGVIGASDAAGFAKFESRDKYVLTKLKSGSFKGNAYTDSGNLWEHRMLDHFGIPRNTLLIASSIERGFAATPDGVEITPTGEIIPAECKAIHGRIVKGPTPAQRRQVWWAQFCLGAVRTKFIWQELDADWIPRRLEPHILVIDRDDAEIAKLLRIAYPVLRGVRDARAYESELSA